MFWRGNIFHEFETQLLIKFEFYLIIARSNWKKQIAYYELTNEKKTNCSLKLSELKM